MKQEGNRRFKGYSITSKYHPLYLLRTRRSWGERVKLNTSLHHTKLSSQLYSKKKTLKDLHDEKITRRRIIRIRNKNIAPNLLDLHQEIFDQIIELTDWIAFLSDFLPFFLFLFAYILDFGL